MAERPSFQFYPGDWTKNSDLRACSEAARGAYMYLRCALHGSAEYGVRRWTLKKLSEAAGVRYVLAKELAEAGILKGADKEAKPLIFQANHAGRKGAPVTLVEHQGGPVWYDEQFVCDDYRAKVRGQSGRFGAEPKPPPNDSPKGGIGDSEGDRQGYGASASASTSLRSNSSTEGANTSEGAARPAGLNLLHVRCAMAMIAAGCPIGVGGQSGNAQDPDLIEACGLGATEKMMADLVKEALTSKHTINNVFRWAVSKALGQLKDRQAGITANGKLSAADAVRANNAAAEKARTTAASRPGAVTCFDPDENPGEYIDADPI